MEKDIANFISEQENEINSLKLNIINWYKFKNIDSILVCGNANKYIVEYLCEKFKKVFVQVDDINKIYELNELKSKFNNIKIIDSTIDKLEIKEKVDYIFMLEYLEENNDDEELQKIILSKAKFLKEDGKILFVSKNKFGAKEIISQTYNGFSKERINNLFIKSGFKYFKYFYLLPDIANVNVIFSDQYLPTKNDIRRNINFSFELTDLGVKENEYYNAILKNGSLDFQNSVNAFFIEISKQEIDTSIRAVYYNNLRPKEYRLKTVVLENNVEKECIDKSSNNHMQSIKYNIDILTKCNINTLDFYQNNLILSQIKENCEKLDDKFLKLYNQDGEKYLNLINKFKNEVLLKLEVTNSKNNVFEKYEIPVSNEVLNNMTFIKHGLLDLTLQNIFQIDDELWVFDQEWYEENIPLEFILYRSIMLLGGLTKSDKEDILNKLQILKYSVLFEKLEHAFQKKLTNYYLIGLYFNTLGNNSENISQEQYKKLYEEYEFQAKLVKSKELRNNELNKKFSNYDEIVAKLQNQEQINNDLNRILNSTTIQTALSMKKAVKPVLPVCRNVGKVTRKICGICTKIFRIPGKVIYKVIPKKMKRKLKNKIQYSKKLSKIAKIPMFSQYNNTLKLYIDNRNHKDVFSQVQLNKTIGIHLHLYYEDLAHEFCDYLSNIPYPFDLYVSIRKDVSTYKIKRIFNKIINLNKLEVKKSENCGRDFGPMFVLFANKLKQYDYIMHIHSKKSLRMGEEQSRWRRYLLNNILGSQERIMKCFYLMENYNIGLVYPDTDISVPYWAHSWLDEAALARNLCERINVKFDSNYLEFSAGSMFWAKKDALAPILDLNLTWEDFGKDKKQTGGTLEYVFERIPGLVTRKTGYDIAIFNESKNAFLLNKGAKNLETYYIKNKQQTIEELSQYDVISFDIFDTLITRKIYDPDDIFKLITLKIEKENINIENYCKLRKQAETNVRIKKNFENDCDIDEIYEEFANIANITLEQSEHIKQLEFETELEFCIPRKDALDIYNSLLQKSKKIILISDMYLTKEYIEKLLNNCGYYNYFELLISSEIGKRKDNGTMWTYFYEKYGMCKTIHVGDNEESDMHKPLDLGKNICHFMQGKKMYTISNYNLDRDFNLQESIILGSIINKGLFNSPFAMHNYNNEAIINNEFKYGYSILGPIILEYLSWLINSLVNTNKKEVILFATREGYYLQKIYNHLIKKLNKEEINSIEQHYFYISRRAVTVAQIEKIEDAYELMRKSFKGTLRELLYYRLGFKYNEAEDRIIELPKDFDIVKAVIDKNAHKILEQVKYEKQNYKQYIEQEIQDIDAKNLNFIDLGYSGTAQYYLSLLLNKKVAGKYFAVSESLKPLGIGCDVDSCYNSNIYDLEEISKNPMYNCSILLEAFLTAPHGQLQYFEKTTNGNVKPIFNFENNLEKVDAFEKIYNAIIEYIDDMFEIFGEDILKLNIDRKIFIDLYRSFIYDSFKMNNDMKYLFDIDDYYCSNGVINGVDIWKSIL